MTEIQVGEGRDTLLSHARSWSRCRERTSEYDMWSPPLGTSQSNKGQAHLHLIGKLRLSDAAQLLAKVICTRVVGARVHMCQTLHGLQAALILTGVHESPFYRWGN